MIALIDTRCCYCGEEVTEGNPGTHNQHDGWCCRDCHMIYYPDWYLSFDSLMWPGKEDIAEC